MALESTAINDLIAGVQQRPLHRDSDDWWFGEADATEIAPRDIERTTTPFDRGAPRVLSLPRPFVDRPAAAFEYALQRSPSPTTYVRTTDWAAVGKKAALPLGLFSLIVVGLGVYFAKRDEKPSATARTGVVMTVKAEEVPVPAQVTTARAQGAPTSTAVAPTATPIAEEKPQPAADTSTHAAAPEPTAAPAQPEPTATAVTQPTRAANVAQPASATKVEALPPTVEPGSPASRFLAPAPIELTLPTVAPKPAPAPTAVPDLPRAKPAAASPERTASAAPARPAAKRVANKTTVQTRAEPRAAAKRATTPASVASTRAKKQVAAAEPATPAKKPGKGMLAITSTPSLEVWVDGKNSHAMTPVRIILLAGNHKVALLDRQKGTVRAFEVEIKPDQTTKVAKSYP